MIIKRLILNLFIEMKKKLFIMLDDKHSSQIYSCFAEIMEVMQLTATKIENIYYKYNLFPKLQKHCYNVGS